MTEFKDEDFEVVHGSGNIYEDFGYPDAKARLAKALLAAEIIRSLREQGLTNVQAAKKTGFDRTEFSRIKEPDLKRFTIDRLMTILDKLDPEIDITMEVKARSKRSGVQQELSL